MTAFNHNSIQELANMATLRNHLFILSQNQNLSSSEDSRKLRKLIGKLDREIVRRALGNLEKKGVTKTTPKSKTSPSTSAKKSAKKVSTKKSSNKKKTTVKRSSSS